MVQLLDQLFVGKYIHRTIGGAVEQRERHPGLRIMLPDKLQHQKLVEIGIEQGSGDRVEFPVVIMCPLCEVHDHDYKPLPLLSSAASATKSTRERLSGTILIQTKTAGRRRRK